MKQAVALLLLSFAFICVVFGSTRSGGVANAQSTQICPSPAPSCSSSGTLSDLNGNYACSQVKTNSSGVISVSIGLLTYDGNGNVSNLQAKNNNGTSTTTFQAFEVSNPGTYCLNTDKTGYIFPSTSSSGCPTAFIIDNGNGTANSEVRQMDSTENAAKLMTCRKQ